MGRGSAIFLQKLFRFVDFRREVGTPASIGVVQHHERAVIFADAFFGHLALASFYNIISN